jgi:hypothetical protein
MVRLSRVFHDYDDAAAIDDLLALWGCRLADARRMVRSTSSRRKGAMPAKVSEKMSLSAMSSVAIRLQGVGFTMDDREANECLANECRPGCRVRASDAAELEVRSGMWAGIPRGPDCLGDFETLQCQETT